MLRIAVLFFVMAIVAGLTLASLYLSDHAPPFWLALIHGVFAATAITLLTIAELRTSARGATVLSLILFEMAAVGGFILFAYYLCGKYMPGTLVVIHGTAAATAFILMFSAFRHLEDERHPVRRGVHWFGTPLHPILTSFPIALWTVSLFWDLLTVSTGSPHWWPLAFGSMAAGLVLAVPTIITGLMDYSVIHSKHPAGQIATRHMIIMLSATATFLTNLIVRGSFTPPDNPSLRIPLTLSVSGLILLALGGWHGGVLVFHHAIGHGRSVPKEKRGGGRS